MIERNLGNVERVVRLLFATVLFGWALQRPDMNAIEWFVIVIATALMMNGVFSRCYLWFLLDINTCGRSDRDCYSDSSCP
jgi:hypothetical protein